MTTCPRYRGTLLEAPTPEQVRADPVGYQRVQDELARGLRLVMGLPIVLDSGAGWLGVRRADNAMALWLLRAIMVEHVAVRREGQVVGVPCGPDVWLDHDIKHVVTVVAKTVHEWTEHRTMQESSSTHLRNQGAGALPH